MLQYNNSVYFSGKKVSIRDRFPHANIPSTIREDLADTAPSPPHTMGSWLEVNRGQSQCHQWIIFHTTPSCPA